MRTIITIIKNNVLFAIKNVTHKIGDSLPQTNENSELIYEMQADDSTQDMEIINDAVNQAIINISSKTMKFFVSDDSDELNHILIFEFSNRWNPSLAEKLQLQIYDYLVNFSIHSFLSNIDPNRAVIYENTAALRLLNVSKIATQKNRP